MRKMLLYEDKNNEKWIIDWNFILLLFYIFNSINKNHNYIKSNYLKQNKSKK